MEKTLNLFMVNLNNKKLNLLKKKKNIKKYQINMELFVSVSFNEVLQEYIFLFQNGYFDQSCGF